MKIKIVIVVFLIITSQLLFAQSERAKNVSTKKIEQEVRQAIESCGHIHTLLPLLEKLTPYHYTAQVFQRFQPSLKL